MIGEIPSRNGWNSSPCIVMLRFMEDTRQAMGRRAFLGATAATAATPLLASPALAGDTHTLDHSQGPGQPIRPQRPERALRELLAQVDRHRVEAVVNRLVQFGTRH